MIAAAGSVGQLVAAGEGPAVWFSGSLVEVKASGATTDGSYDFFEQLLPPGYAPPLHAHRQEDEAFYLLDGELALVCGERRERLAPGGYVHLPRGIPHSFQVEGDRAARMVVLSVPAGVLDFFAELGAPAIARVLPDLSPHDPEAMRGAADRYGIEILGPPPV